MSHGGQHSVRMSNLRRIDREEKRIRNKEYYLKNKKRMLDKSNKRHKIIKEGTQ